MGICDVNYLLFCLKSLTRLFVPALYVGRGIGMYIHTRILRIADKQDTCASSSENAGCSLSPWCYSMQADERLKPYNE